MNLTTICIASDAYRWNGRWVSAGIGYGVEDLKVDGGGPLFDLDSSDDVVFFDARIGSNISEHIGIFFQATQSGIGSHTAGFANLYARPSTSGTLFVFGGIGFYNNVNFQVAASAGAGIDLAFLSADIRAYRGIGKDSVTTTESSGVMFTVSCIFGFD